MSTTSSSRRTGPPRPVPLDGRDGRAGDVVRGSFSSSDAGRIAGFIERVYAENAVRLSPVRGRARFRLETHDTTLLGTDRLRSSIDYEVTSGAGVRDHVFLRLNAGEVRLDSRDRTVTAGPHDVLTYPLSRPLTSRLSGVDATVLRVPAHRLAACLEEVTGAPASEVHFLEFTPVSPQMRRYWNALTTLVAGALADDDSPLASPLLAEQMTRTVAVAALQTFPHRAFGEALGPSGCAPATVRRAVAYLEEHAHEPVLLSDVAAAAATSARALQHGFRRYLGTSPLGYLRRVRLHRAHEDLLAADPAAGDTVAAVAVRWGFTPGGRFAATYRRAFGVLPGQTLRR